MYIPRGFYLGGLGTVRDAGTCFWVRVRCVSTCFRYGYCTGVRYGSTVRGYGTGGTVLGYGTGVRRTGTVYPPYLFSGNVVLFPKRYGGYTVPVRRTPVPYPRTVPSVPYPRTVPPVPYPRTVPPYRTPVPYSHTVPRTVPPYRTRTRVRTHRTYPPYVPVPTPKSYPIFGSPATR